MPSKYCTIYITRHGQTTWNLARKIQGHSDSPLTADGKQQAHAAKTILKTKNFQLFTLPT